MKIIHQLTVLLFSVFLLVNNGYGQNTWTNGNATGIWNDAGNWSGGIPGAADDVVFDATSTTNCAIDVNASVNSITIAASYAGTVTQNTGTTIDVAADFTQNGGTFSGGDSYIDINGALTLSAGTFTATSNELRCATDFDITGAVTFNNNSGTVLFDGGTNNNSFDINSTLSLYDLEIAKGNNNRRVAIGANDVITITNDLTLTNGEFNSADINNPGKLRLNDGSVSLNIASTFDGGTSVLLIDHTRTVGVPASIRMNGLELTDAGATVNIGNLTVIEGPIILTNGTIDDQGNSVDYQRSITVGASGTFTTTGTSILSGENGTIDVQTTHTFNNLTINKSGGNRIMTIASGDTLITTGTLTLTNGNFNTGVLEPQSTVTHNSTYDGGDAALYLGSAATVSLSTGAMLGIHLNNAGAVVDCPTSGALRFEGDILLDNGTFNGHGSTGTGNASLDIDEEITINGGTFNFSTGTTNFAGSLTYTAGTVNHQNGTVIFNSGNDETIDLSSSISLFNVDLAMGNNDDLIISNSNLIASNNLDLSNGRIQTGIIEVGAVVTLDAGFDGANAGGRISFTSGNSSTSNFGAGGSAPGIIVQAGATCTINGPTIGNSLVIEGLLSMAGGSFVGDNGEITINSTMDLSGTAAFTATSLGELTVSGDFSQTSGTPSFTGGTAAMDFNGSFTQSVGTFTAGSGNFDIAGAFSLGGTAAFTSTTSGTILFSNTVSITGGSYTGGADVIDMNSTFTQSAGTFDAGAGNIDITGAVSLSGTADFTANSSGTFTMNDPFTQSDATSTFTGGAGAIDLNDNLTVNDGSFTASSSNFNFSGTTWDMNAAASAAFTANGGTVIFDRNTNSSPTITLGANTNFNNVTVNLTSGNGGRDNLEIAGNDIVVGSSGTLTLTDGEINTGTIQVAGQITNTTSFDGGTGSIHITGGGFRFISLTSTAEMPAIRLNDANATLNFPNSGANILTIEGDLTIDNGNAVVLADQLLVNSNYSQTGGTLTQNTGEIQVNGTFSQSGGNFTGGSGILDFNSTFSQSAGSFSAGSSNIDITSTFSLSGTAAFTSTSSGTITIGGNVTITAGSYTGGADVIDMNGNFDQSGGTFNAGAGGIDIAGSMVLSGTGSFTANSSGTFSLGTTYTQTDATSSFDGSSGDMDFNNTFSVTDGAFTSTSGTFTYSGGNWTKNAAACAAFDANSGTIVYDRNVTSSPNVNLGAATTFNNVTVNLTNGGNNRDNLVIIAGDMIIGTSGTLNLVDGEINTGTIQVAGVITNSTTFDGGNGNIVVSGGGVRSFTLTATAEMPAFQLNDANATVNISNTGGNTLTIEGDLDVDNGNLNIQADRLLVNNTFDQSGGVITQTSGEFEVSSTYVQSAGSFTGGTGEIDLNSSFSQSGGTFSAGAGDVNISTSLNLTNTASFTSSSAGTITIGTDINITGGSYTGGADVVNVGDDINQTGGSIDFGAGDVNINDDINLSGTGSLTAVSSGTFTAQAFNQTGAASVFNGSTGNMDLNDLLSVSDGIFTACSGNLDFTGASFTLNAAAVGNFSNNGGTIQFQRNNSQTLSMGADLTLNNVEINLTNNNGNRDNLVLSGADMIIDGNLLMVDGQLNRNSTEETEIRGTMDATGGVFSGGSAVLHVTNGGVRTISFTEGTTTIPPLQVNDANATVRLPDEIGETFTIGGNLDVDLGVLTARTSDFTVTGNYQQDGGTFNGAANDYTVNGTYALNNGAYNATTGTYNALGNNFYVSATSTFNSLGGTIVFNRNNNITVDLDATTTFGNVTVNMTGGNDNLTISDQDMITTGLLYLQNGEILTGRVEVQGTISTSGGLFSGGTGQLDVTNGGVRSFTLDAAIIPEMIVDDANATVGGPASGVLRLEGNLSVVAGTLNAGAGEIQVDDDYIQSGGSFNGSTGIVDVQDNFTLNGTGAFTAPSGTLFIEDNFDHDAPATFNPNNGTVQFDGNQTRTVSYDGGDLVFFNLVLAKTNNNREVRFDSDLDINGSLTITSGRLETDQTIQIDINLAGDYRNDNGANGLLQNNCEFTFDGGGDQNIDVSGGETFYDLTINKAGGVVILNDEILTTNVMTMTSGNVLCDGNDAVINSYLSLSGAGAASYFRTTNGGAFRVGYPSVDASSRTIHLGDASNYTPFVFQLSSATLASANMRFSVTDSGHPNRVDAVDYLLRYWSFTPTGITGTISYDMSYTYLNGDIFGDENNFVGAKYSGGSWIEGGSVNTATNTVSWTSQSTFSDAYAMDNVSSPLPIELIDFSADLINGKVELSWQTATEINNEYFLIEKTRDGKTFELVTRVEGAGTILEKQSYSATDHFPYQGVSYYRLTQFDYDGSSEDFPLEVIHNLKGSSEQFLLFPNPSSERELNVRFSSKQFNEGVESIRLLRSDGTTVYSMEMTDENLNQATKIELDPNLPAGNYFLVIETREDRYSSTVVFY